ncbi:MAG: ABC transporter ATP-binding protein [Propionibacteriaceae bacterium]|jgi:iron complex transport system ATP-binding protein|nr:ABC transporter ATP-binding protein [Propionibacteriaceae bacterium]
MNAVIDVEDVTVRRGQSLLLDRVDWTVDETDRWVVIGPNGAGKTTLMRIVSANLFPTSGRVRLLDQELGRVDVFELRPRIGVCSTAMTDQIPPQEPVGDVVMSAAYAIFGRWREDYLAVDRRRAELLMEALRVDHLSARRFGTLSEGERKRVQIARALMTDPELLILDEPTAGLDLAGRELLLETLADVASDPRSPASILVTHHVEEIPLGVTHALLLKAGRVVAAGPIAEALTAATMSQTFDLPLELGRRQGRWWAQAVSGPRPGSTDVRV